MKYLILAAMMLYTIASIAQRPQEGGMVTVYVPDTVFIKQKIDKVSRSFSSSLSVFSNIFTQILRHFVSDFINAILFRVCKKLSSFQDVAGAAYTKRRKLI